MKILLTALNSKYIHSNLAVYSLKSYAGDFSKHIKIKEFTINNRFEEIIKEIYLENPDVIMFSCYVWNIEFVKRLVNEIPKIMQDVHIWLGGPEVSFETKEFLNENKSVKGVMVGEGEETFKELSEHYVNKNKSLNEINGVIYRDLNNNIIENKDRLPIDLNNLIFPYQDINDFENRIIYYESSRGCPFSCSYCMSSIDKSLRFKDINITKKELGFFLEKKIKQVKFVDRTFNCNQEYALQVWKFIHEHDNGITNFHFEIAADLLNDEQIETLGKMREGLVQFETGVQSTNQKTLKEIRRKMDFSKVSEMTLKIKTLKNIHQHLDLIVGLPGEGYEGFKMSFNDVYELKPENLQLGFLKVLKGSLMHDNALQYNMLYSYTAPYEIFSTDWISYDEVLRLKEIEEVVEVYYNSGNFLSVVNYLEKKFRTPFDMYEKLGAFYSANNKFEKHARINNYYLILDFATKNSPNDAEVFKELLTHEIYLKEKIKSRPDFSRDLNDYVKEKREKYQELYDQNVFSGYENYSLKQIMNMTHMEIYDRDILEYDEVWGFKEQRTYILYDYRNRRIHSAKIC